MTNDDARGKFTLSSKTTSPEGTSSAKTRGKVLCLKVIENNAVFVGQVTASKNSEFDEGDFVQVDVTDVDGSGPSTSGTTPTTDTFFFQESTDPPLTGCPTPAGGLIPLEKGDIIVNDAGLDSQA